MNTYEERYGSFLQEKVEREVSELNAEIKQERFARSFKNKKAKLKKKIKSKLTDEELTEKQRSLTMLQQKLARSGMEQRERKLMVSHKRKEREKVANGKQPYFLKKADKKRLLLEEQFKHLEKKGTLDKFIMKRRKKNSQKDRKLLPDQRG